MGRHFIEIQYVEDALFHLTHTIRMALAIPTDGLLNLTHSCPRPAKPPEHCPVLATLFEGESHMPLVGAITYTEVMGLRGQIQPSRSFLGL